MLMIEPTTSVRWTVGRILDERNISTAEFARMAQIQYQTALLLRRGVTTQVDTRVLGRVCSALDVQPGDVLVLDEDKAN